MARARRNVASPPPQQPTAPNFEDFAAASGAAELLPPEAAVAAVPVAGALTTAAAAAAVAGVLAGFASFNVKRERALRTYLTDTLVRMYPDRTREEILRFVRDELARDRAFVRNQQERLQKDLVEAMKLDAEKRDARVQAVLDRERRYTQMHEQAAIERAAARTSFLNVKDASPDGALWMLGRATTHTPSCVGMAGKFWPWQVLDKLHPQLHAGCQCYLVGKGEAVERGFMHEDQARVDPKDALARAAEIAKLEDIVMEAATPEEIRSYMDAIQEAPYRLPHGVHGGGEFARRGQTGVPILARRAIEKMLRRLAPHPSTPAQRRRDAAGEWRRIGKREVFVPEHRAWDRELDGKRFVSPPQSTAVYDRERKPPVEVSPEKQEQVAKVGKDIKEQWRVRAFEKARGALAKQDAAVAPVEVGDKPQAAHKGLLDAGFFVSDQRFSEQRKGLVTRTYEHPATQASVQMTAFKRKVTHVGWNPGRAPRRPKPLLDRPPATHEEFFDDVFSLAHALAAGYGHQPHMEDVRITDIPDMGGEHTWEGITHLGVDANAALDALVRAKGRPLTFGESRLVYSLYRAASHEALHASAPIRPGVYADMNDTTGRVLEEALTEELASVETVNMLRRQGLTDVLRWVKANPTDFKVEGAYSRYRRVLSRVLDRAKVPPEERENVIRALKFGIDPDERAAGLAALVAGSDLGRGMDVEDTRDWIQSISNRSHALTVAQSEPIFAPNIRPDLSDVPDVEPVKVKGVPLFPGTRVSVRGRGSVGVVQQIYHRDDGPLLDVEYGPPGMRTWFDHGVHPDQIDGVGEPPEGISPRRGGVRIDGQVFQPGDTVSYLGDRGRTRATVERIIRAENPDLPAPRRGWQIEATTEAGVPVLLDHGRARGLRHEVASDIGYDPGVTGEVMTTRATPGGERPEFMDAITRGPVTARTQDIFWAGWKDLKQGDRVVSWHPEKGVLARGTVNWTRVARKGQSSGLTAVNVSWDNGQTGNVSNPGRLLRREDGPFEPTMQAEPFRKYGAIPEKIKWKSAGPGVYDSADGRLTMYRIEGVRPPAWNVEWTTGYAYDVQGTSHVEGYGHPIYTNVVDGAATMKDAKAFAEDEWPRLRERIAEWEAAQPVPTDKSFMPHRVEVAGWTADNDSVTWTGYGMSQDEAVEDAKRGGGIVEVGDVNVLPPLNRQTPGGERGLRVEGPFKFAAGGSRMIVVRDPNADDPDWDRAVAKGFAQPPEQRGSVAQVDYELTEPRDGERGRVEIGLALTNEAHRRQGHARALLTRMVQAHPPDQYDYTASSTSDSGEAFLRHAVETGVLPPGTFTQTREEFRGHKVVRYDSVQQRRTPGGERGSDIAYHVYPEHEEQTIRERGVVPGYHGSQYEQPRVFAFRDAEEARWYAGVQEQDAASEGIRAPDGSRIRMKVTPVDVSGLDVGKDWTLSGDDESNQDSSAIYVKGGIPADRVLSSRQTPGGERGAEPVELPGGFVMKHELIRTGDRLSPSYGADTTNVWPTITVRDPKAIKDGKTTSYVGQLSLEPDGVTISHIDVAPEFQRRGIATAMLDYARSLGYAAGHDERNMSPAARAWRDTIRRTPGGEREDYRGSHTAPAREEGTSLDDPTNAFGGDEIYGPNALRYYGSGGPAAHQDPETQAWARRSQQASRESLAAIQAARGNPDHKLTVYRAVPKDGGDRIHPGDWVTPSKTYAEIHGESNLSGYEEEPNLDWKVVSQEVRAGDLFTDGDLSEWGWQPEIEPYIPSPAWLAVDLIPREWMVEHGYAEIDPMVGFRHIPYKGVPGGMDDKDALRVLYHYFTGSTDGWTRRSKKQKDEVLAQAVERWKAANPRWAEQGWVKR